jgi:hypothetical protein
VNASTDVLDHLRRVKQKHEAELLQKRNVVGVGIGRRQASPGESGEPVIVVSVTHKVPRHQLLPHDLIPQELDGVPVDVRSVGTLRPVDVD